MEIKVKLDEFAFLPTRAHDTDAGWDIKTPVDINIAPRQYTKVDTKVHMIIPKGYVGMVKSRSGMNQHGIQCEGVLDAGYVGSIGVTLYNNGTVPLFYPRGSRIAQVVILPIPETELVEVESLPMTERGSRGFGSSGR